MYSWTHVTNLTLKLPGEGQMALPLNLNDKNIPNADFSWYFKFIQFFFDKVWVDCNWKHLQKFYSFEWKIK